jgi:molybdopterin-guanine dinucleotide biosynthesis protein MobB
MRIVSIIGSKNSGKTTTIEYLLHQLSSRGLNVGSAKHMHDLDASVDQPGKDTARHASAGSKVIVGVSPRELALIKKGNTSQFTLETLIKLLEGENLDILLFEGFHAQVSRRPDIFKIVTAKDKNDAANTLRGTSPPILAITGPITTHQHPSEIAGIPVVDLEREGGLLANQIAALARSVT